MTLDNEEAVRSALGITSFRELSKDKMLAFAASMPDMAKEVRMKLIDQIPGFQKFALDAVSAVERVFTETMSNDDRRSERIHESLADVREAITSQLQRDDISEEHAAFLTAKLMETALVEVDSQSDGRAHEAHQAGETRKAAVALAGIGLIAAIVLAGGKVALGRNSAA